MVAQDRPKSLNMSTYDTLRESRLGLGVKGSQVQILAARLVTEGIQDLRFPRCSP